MKKLLLILAVMLPCLGAWAEIVVSTSVETPEATYSLQCKNGAYMSAGTGATQFNIGRFAFYETGVENAYKIYSVDAKKWVSYTKSNSYADGADKATLIEEEANAQAWNVVANVVNNVTYYNIAPYRNDGGVAVRYWNLYGGFGPGKPYAYDNSKTVGLYNDKADGGSLWTLEKLTLATEEQVNAAKAFIVVGPGYPKTTTSVYKAMNALTYGKSTTKHIALAQSEYQTTNDVVLPEDGKAYTFTALFKNGNKLYMKYVNGQKVSVSTNPADASTFVCKQLRAGVYAFVTEDGRLLTWVGNNESNAYIEEGFNAPNGYSNYYATTYNTKSDWNEITVKKNQTSAEQLGLLRLVGRRHKTATSAIIANKNTRFDQSSDTDYFNNDNTSGWIVTEVAHTNTPAQNAALAKIAVKEAGYTFGTNVGEYYYMDGEDKVSDKATAISTLDAKETADDVNAFKGTFTLNMPVAGKFYTFKQDNYYLTSGVTSGGRIAMSTAKDATALYYYDGTHLLAYTTGKYIGLNENDWTFEAVGSNDISNIEFIVAANGVTAKYNIKSGGRWLHRTDAYVNRCQNNTCGNAHNWSIEEVTLLPVTITSAGYASFYAPVAVEVEEGVTANTVTVNDEWATLNAIENGIIPAGTGVVLQGSEGTYNFAITTADALENKGVLLGTAAASYISEDAYVLANVGTADNVEVGFAKAIKNQQSNTSWLNNAFKAYLPASVVPTTAQALRFNIGGTTGIEEAIVAPDANAPIYDLSGRRIMNAVKGGIYIQNGKKFIVK